MSDDSKAEIPDCAAAANSGQPEQVPDKILPVTVLTFGLKTYRTHEPSTGEFTEYKRRLMRNMSDYPPAMTGRITKILLRLANEPPQYGEKRDGMVGHKGKGVTFENPDRAIKALAKNSGVGRLTAENIRVFLIRETTSVDHIPPDASSTSTD